MFHLLPHSFRALAAVCLPKKQESEPKDHASKQEIAHKHLKSTTNARDTKPGGQILEIANICPQIPKTQIGKQQLRKGRP
ncbi:MAG TPA: hypothetical protein VNW54_03330 [Granulicella sp.]|jgi:hypothetical protein|nr:hypothetical protein [Granulicella sp.]